MTDWDWDLAALYLVGWVVAMLYASSKPKWLVALWRQIERPVRWIERKIRRDW